MSKAESNIVAAALTTCAVSATRATFLAGYAYYQCGRYNFAIADDVSYIWFFRITFELCVLAAFTSEFVSYYIHRMPTVASKLAFIKKAVAYPRLVFQCFLWALIFYSLALSRIGEVYYPAGCPAKVIPAVIFSILPGILFSMAVYIIYTSFKIEGMTGVEVNEAISVYKKSGTHFLIGEFDGIVQRVQKQSDVLAGRAVYVAGMAQAGLWAYRMASTEDGAWFYAPESTVVLGKLFLSSCCFALSFGLFAAMTLSCITVFVQDMQGDDKKIVMTYRCLALIKYSFYSYFASFLCVTLAILFMPWGCQYVDQASINVPIAVIATLACIAGLYWCTKAFRLVGSFVAKEEAAALTAAPLTAEELKTQKQYEVDEARFVDGTLNQIRNFGAQGTLASGFVFYNVVTFFTDVIKLPYQNQQISNIFLFFNVLAICSGLMAAVLDSLITGFAGQFTTYREKFLFLQYTKMLGRLVELCFYMGMGSWYALFAVCGYTKFIKSTALPAIASIVSIFISLVGSTYLDSAFSWVNVGRWDGAAVDALSEVGKLKLEKRSGVFSNSSYNVLFLGGFAYNCIIFFNFQTDEESRRFAETEQWFVGVASACFALSISIITLSSSYDVFNTNCLSKAQSYAFSLLAEPIFNACMIAAALVVLLLIIAFGLIGFVKQRLYYPNWEAMAPVMLWSSVATFLLILVFGLRIRRHVDTVREECHELASDGKKYSESDRAKQVAAKHYDFSKALMQYAVLSGTSSFVAGNVCYEILFSEAKKMGPQLWQSYWYFICNNITFSFGVCTVSLSTLMTLSIWEMETVTEKHMLASQLHHIKGALFAMSVLSLFFWMFGTILGDGVKYSGRHLRGGDYDAGFVCGIFCCAIAIYVGVSVKQHSDVVLQEMKEGKSSENIKRVDNTVVTGTNPLHDNDEL